MKNIRLFFVTMSICASALLHSQNNKKLKILFVLTSHNELGNTGKKTGFWIEEFATPYYFFKDQGVEIVVATPEGGQAPIDPKSNEAGFQTESTKRYFNDPKTQKILGQTKKLSDVSSTSFDAVFYPGGHGPMWDLANNKHSMSLIRSFYEAKKPIAFVCHGPAALVNVTLSNGDYLVKNKQLTAFCNSEEQAVQLTQVVPFSLEDKLKERGATYRKGADWSSYTVSDELLLTGQNPQSSAELAEKLLKLLKHK